MAGVKVPKIDDPLRWADWLEISAAFNADGNSSRADLEGALRISPFFEKSGQEGIANRITEVFAELNERTQAAGTAYPFTLDRAVLQIKSDLCDFPAYFFCLCLSYCGWTQNKGSSVFPARMFEDLSCMAAQSYTGGDVACFAYPRTRLGSVLPSGFKAAIQMATERLREGDSCRNRPARSTKDDALDVLAWRHFPDLLPGKLVLVGQCATGDDWEGKLSDLQPIATTDEWMSAPIISQMLRAIFVPHRIPREEWERSNRRAGIVFDRCRLAYWAHRKEHLEKMKIYCTWSSEYIKSALVSGPSKKILASSRTGSVRTKRTRGLSKVRL
jgi:hypothetical protein